MIDGEISFGRFRLDLARRELWRDGVPVRLGNRALDILCELVSAQGGVVTKDELMARVWAGVVVEENNLQVHISALRRALEEGGDWKRWIVTVPGRGYRLLRSPGPPAADKSAAEPTLPVADQPSLAVLPFHNLSGDPEQDYFADGIVEELITALSRIRWLFVTARNSSFAYKGQSVDVKRVGRELGVPYVLEGSVRKSGNRIRITCQLIDATTGAHLWADHFDGPMEDVFDLQGKVASSVAGAIEPTLQAAEAAHSTGRPTNDLTAYDLYLRAHAMIWSAARQIPEALGLLEQAIRRDPRYGPALAWAAFCCFRLHLDGSSEDPAADRLKGVDFARRALAVAGDDPNILVQAAEVLSYFGEDIDAMMALVDRALALNPNFARGWHVSGILRLDAGQLEIAIKHAENALRLSPRARVGTSLTMIGQAHFLARRFDEAAPKLSLAIHEDPSFTVPYRYLAACYAHMGRLAEARDIVSRLRALSPVVIPDAGHLRNGEHRELFLSGLRLATGEEGGVMAPPPRVDTPREAAPVAHGEPERRQITALSCELAGATAGALGIDLEDWREAVGEFRRCVSETAARHAGFVAWHLGNGVLVLFGYPEAREHDAERAVRAGLELCAAVRILRPDADAPLRCRIGIATGMVILGDPVGARATRGESVVGEAPNLAARLALSAQPDTVTIEPATRRLIGNLFDCRERGALEAAGGSEPIRSWQVLGESLVESRFEALRGPALTRLVGRDEEIDLLLRRWARAKTGDGQIVLVSGEPGIGKSRLTAALEERLGDEPHLRLRYFCSPYHQDSALFPFIDQLGHAAGFARDDPPATRLEKLEALLSRAGPPDEDGAFLAHLLSLPASERHPLPNLSPQRKKEKTLAALIRQLEGLARQTPVVVVCEDAQWIDPTSHELLDLTVERVRTLSVLLIVTFRSEFQPPWTGQPQVTILALNRLDRRDRSALVEQIAGGKALPHDLVAQIAERTDGVPLFVEELTKAVVESGADRGYVSISAVPPSSLAVPTTLHASLLGRLDRLGPVAKNVAQVGAAIGHDFSHELLAAAVQLAEPELQEALHRLVEAGLVFQRGMPPAAEYLFKHALVQDTAYSTLLRGPRRALHQRIAEALEQRFPDPVETRPEILARHYGEAAMPDKAITYWHLAGKLSVAKSAVREAIAQLRRGLSLLDGLPETRERQQLELDIHVTLTAALMAGKGYASPETVAALERANRLVAETASVGTPIHFSVLYGLWVSTCHRGTIAAGLERATNFLSFAQSQPSSGPLLVAHRILAYSLILSGDYRAALAHVETAASLHRPDEHRDSAFRYGQDIGVSAFVHLSWALWHRGYPDQSARVADRALALSRQLGHAHTLSYAFYFAGMAAVFARDVATVCALSNDCVTLASEHGFAQWAACGRVLQGWADAQKGEATTGIARIRDGLAAREATGARAATPLFFTLLAEALALAGKIEEGIAALDDALAKAAVSGERGWDAEIHRLCGELTSRLAHPDPAKAEDSFRTALAIAREQGTRGYELRAATSLARLRRDQGRRGEARDLLAPIYGWFTEGFDTPDLKEAKALLDELGAD
jgi:TolB-like protein/class 3 adenylate cyclase/predicted ATPase